MVTFRGASANAATATLCSNTHKQVRLHLTKMLITVAKRTVIESGSEEDEREINLTNPARIVGRVGYSK